MKRLRVLLLSGALVASLLGGIEAIPAAIAPAQAANCATLPARIASHNADAQNYNSQVSAINARGGGNPGQVAFYNSWRARGIARGNALAAELSQCQSQGQLRGIKPPVQPGGRRSGPPPGRMRPPTNPTPGFPRPEKYGPGQNVRSDRTTPGNGRNVKFNDGGNADFGGLRAGRASTMNAKVSRDMLDTGSLSRSRGPGAVTPRGFGGSRQVRGHLLAKILGGKGGDARNIVPLTRSANAKMRTIERQVYNAVKNGRGCKVDYIVVPMYGGGIFGAMGPSPYPVSIAVIARGCGLNISRTIRN
ncbi:DNA/RNA non-specific endonuclease [Gordonia sp. X0973]|nr:DNA/RNA non-specific endonuclease [Gordonia sp. X0973]